MSSGIQCFVKRFRGRRERRVKRKGMKERDWKRRRRGSGENSRKSRRVSQEGKVEILWADFMYKNFKNSDSQEGMKVNGATH